MLRNTTLLTALGVLAACSRDGASGKPVASFDLAPTETGGLGPASTAPDLGDGIPLLSTAADIAGCEVPQPGASPIRRLTRFEYDNTVRTLLGTQQTPGQRFPEEGGSGFDNNADVSVVSRLLADKYLAAAEQLSAEAIASISGLLGCDPAPDERGCVQSWVSAFGSRAFRRPVSEPEVTDMMLLFDQLRAQLPLDETVRGLFEAFLQSPHFLYRVELGVGDPVRGILRLSGYELASRLSYFLWADMPDAVLIQQAAAGMLDTQAQVEQQARRLLQDPKARIVAYRFHKQWLGLRDVANLEKSADLYPDFTPEVTSAMETEVRTFIDHVLWGTQGTLGQLLTSPVTFVNADLAAYYGFDGSFGPDFQLVQDDPTKRAGILTQGALMATYAHADETHPIQRGLMVREKLFCQLPAPPPENVNTELPPIDINTTNRQRLEQHRADPACAGCHQLFDPIGLGFEHYDASGRYRDTEGAGLTVDASGTLVGTDVDGEFSDAVQLAQMMGRSKMVADCAVRHWFRFAAGRTESETLDHCNISYLSQRFAASQGNIAELMVAITQSDAFMFRQSPSAQANSMSSLPNDATQNGPNSAQGAGQ